MGLRCSLLGHDYGDSEQEAEQERRGDEKVLTVREFRRCSRCGAETVISENTEVTTVERDDDEDAADAPEAGDADAPTADDADERAVEGPVPDDAGESDVGTAGGAGAPGGVDVDPSVDDDAIILDDDSDDEGSAPADEGVAADDGSVADDAAEPEPDAAGPDDDAADDATPAAAAGDGPDSGPTPDEEPASVESDDADAVGVDGNGTAADASAEWPAVEDDPDEDGGDHQPWPEVEGDDEGFDAEPGGDDPAVEFGGLTPEAADEDGTAEYVGEDVVGGESTGEAGAATGAVDGVGITSAGSVGRSDDVVGAELVCPECGFSQEAVSTSLREGDICPQADCGRGYLTERRS